MKMKMGTAGLPVGSYKGFFTGQEACESKFGPGLKWGFEVDEGELAGRRTSRITGVSPNPQNTAGKMLAAVAGKELASGDEVELDSLIGNRYLIAVVESETGGTRVDTVLPLTNG